MEKLILFDIDGTLTDSGSAGSISLTKTFRAIFGIDDAFRHIRMDGKTDIQIIKEGLAAHRLEAGAEVVDAILSNYLKCLKREIHNDRKHLKPGIGELLGTIEAMDGCRLGLLTGNVEEGARIKLAAFDLNRYFPWGAFGSDHEERNRLLPLAVEKYRRISGRKIPFEHCVVVGDTPRDVDCAKPYGAVAVAVATGNYDYAALRLTGADHVLRDLTGPPQWLSDTAR
jgi:phosphoglycolate phosphatase-like HAD superfamily hydrolase